MNESQLAEFIKRFAEKGIDDEEVGQYKNLRLLDNSDHSSRIQEIKGVGELDYLSFSQNNFSRMIRGVRLQSDLQIRLTEFEPSHLMIEDCTFGGWLEILTPQNEPLNASITIKKTRVNSLTLFGVNARSIHFEDCTLNLQSYYPNVETIELINCFGNIDFGATAEQGSEKFTTIIRGGNEMC